MHIESEWIIGSGTISSTVDEIRISNTVSNDWVSAVYQNQKAVPSFPTTPNALTGPPSFTSANRFVISAENHLPILPVQRGILLPSSEADCPAAYCLTLQMGTYQVFPLPQVFISKYTGGLC